jgi:hypothetical protein
MCYCPVWSTPTATPAACSHLMLPYTSTARGMLPSLGTSLHRLVKELRLALQVRRMTPLPRCLLLLPRNLRLLSCALLLLLLLLPLLLLLQALAAAPASPGSRPRISSSASAACCMAQLHALHARHQGSQVGLLLSQRAQLVPLQPRHRRAHWHQRAHQQVAAQRVSQRPQRRVARVVVWTIHLDCHVLAVELQAWGRQGGQEPCGT